MRAPTTKRDGFIILPSEAVGRIFYFALFTSACLQLLSNFDIYKMTTAMMDKMTDKVKSFPYE